MHGFERHPAELVQQATKLAPMLRERSTRADCERRLADDTIDALTRAGLFRVWTPKRYGGCQASFATHFSMITELAKGCTSTAWTMAMFNYG